MHLASLLTHFLLKQPVEKCRLTEDSTATVPKARLSVFSQKILLDLSFWRVQSEKNWELFVRAVSENSIMLPKPS